MEISTRNLQCLVDVEPLRRLLQSMAMLDALLMRDWEYRHYSFNAHWGTGEMLGSMRNGQGDELFALFNGSWAFLKGYMHDSPAAAAGIQSEFFYRDLPAQFKECCREPACSPDDVTFCIWRFVNQPAWSCSKVDLPVGDDADGSARMLSMLDGVPETYREWATAYYQRDVPLKAVQSIYEQQRLTEELVIALNPQQSLSELKPDIAEIGYAIDR